MFCVFFEEFRVFIWGRINGEKYWGLSRLDLIVKDRIVDILREDGKRVYRCREDKRNYCVLRIESYLFRIGG